MLLPHRKQSNVADSPLKIRGLDHELRAVLAQGGLESFCPPAKYI